MRITYQATAAGQPVTIVADYTPAEHGEPSEARVLSALFEGHDIFRALVVGGRAEAERLQAECLERCEDVREEARAEAESLAIDHRRFA